MVIILALSIAFSIFSILLTFIVLYLSTTKINKNKIYPEPRSAAV